jgi:hypothetical protein
MVMSKILREQFRRLSDKRLAAACKQIELLGNLSSTGYEWSPAEVTKIFKDIVAEAKKQEGRFHRTRRWKGAS